MIAFCKTPNCPSSQDLLAFENGDVTFKKSSQIETHLSACEFCQAEVEFYAHYPQSEDPIPRVEIPIPLYELAEALLGNRHKDFTLLNKLLCENEVNA